MLKAFFVALVLGVSSAQAQDYVRVTYYNLSGITASGEAVRSGICAVSSDLQKKYPLGSYIKLEGYGIFKVSDKTASYIKNTIDIWSKKPINNGYKIKCEKHTLINRDYKQFLLLKE